MKTFDEYLSENQILTEVDVRHEQYQGAHGKKPSGHGNWMFSHHKNVDFKQHKEGHDFTSHNGSYSEAKKHAQQWAKSKGHSVVHVQS